MKRLVLTLALSVLLAGPAWAKRPILPDPPPTPNADCGTGAVVSGSMTEGMVTLGADLNTTDANSTGICTLTIPLSAVKCFANDEVTFSGFPAALGVRTENVGANTLIEIIAAQPNEVIGYGCTF
jgi:hypothetical protein